jgi:L-alanine-DL-glutamate epimerase-like enolase superfamily enzyme
MGEPLPENGFVTVPDRPGFGVELKRDYLVPFEEHI